MADSLTGVEALLFDVFGTVVDWRSCVEMEVGNVVASHNIDFHTTDPGWEADFSQEWRDGYLATTRAIAEGSRDLGTTNVDKIHRQLLHDMLDAPDSRWKLLASALDEEGRDKLNGVWHRLRGWPDSTPGLYALKKNVICGALSNGNVRLLVDMARFADLPWDIVFSTELFNTFKPNPEAYLSATRHLSIQPSHCAMVATHLFDLRAAGALGMRTVYIPRLGEDKDIDVVVKSKAEGGEVDLVVQSLEELASIIVATKRE